MAWTTSEVEELLFGRPHIRFWEKGKVRGEDLYLGLWTNRRRPLLDRVLHSQTTPTALPISARDMTDSERKYLQ
jgi:hypothetical protein